MRTIKDKIDYVISDAENRPQTPESRELVDRAKHWKKETSKAHWKLKPEHPEYKDLLESVKKEANQIILEYELRFNI